MTRLRSAHSGNKPIIASTRVLRRLLHRSGGGFDASAGPDRFAGVAAVIGIEANGFGGSYFIVPAFIGSSFIGPGIVGSGIIGPGIIGPGFIAAFCIGVFFFRLVRIPMIPVACSNLIPAIIPI